MSAARIRLQETLISSPGSGGQDAVVGTSTASGDNEPAGDYFIEFFGASGGGSLKLAIDGNVTAIPVVGSGIPELSTWAMLGVGFVSLGLAKFLSRRTAAATA
jgi:hypothetical protein